jgi:hypothetical protein
MTMTHSKPQSATPDPVAGYAKAQPTASKAICEQLQTEIDRALPKATSKIWHGGPVWFLGANPIIGYKVRSKGVDLTFWSGQLFDEPLLQPAGKDKAAKVGFEDETGISIPQLRRWLKKSRTMVFDYAHACARKRTRRA